MATPVKHGFSLLKRSVPTRDVVLRKTNHPQLTHDLNRGAACYQDLTARQQRCYLLRTILVQASTPAPLNLRESSQII